MYALCALINQFYTYREVLVVLNDFVVYSITARYALIPAFAVRVWATVARGPAGRRPSYG